MSAASSKYLSYISILRTSPTKYNAPCSSPMGGHLTQARWWHDSPQCIITPPTSARCTSADEKPTLPSSIGRRRRHPSLSSAVMHVPPRQRPTLSWLITHPTTRSLAPLPKLYSSRTSSTWPLGASRACSPLSRAIVMTSLVTAPCQDSHIMVQAPSAPASVPSPPVPFRVREASLGARFLGARRRDRRAAAALLPNEASRHMTPLPRDSGPAYAVTSRSKHKIQPGICRTQEYIQRPPAACYYLPAALGQIRPGIRRAARLSGQVPLGEQPVRCAVRTQASVPK